MFYLVRVFFQIRKYGELVQVIKADAQNVIGTDNWSSVSSALMSCPRITLASNGSDQELVFHKRYSEENFMKLQTTHTTN
jgi:hypothetical protein